MTIRMAKNKLTGRTPLLEPDVVLGRRDGGVRGVTVHLPHAYSYVCFDNPKDLDNFIRDLQIAKEYLERRDTVI